MVYFLSLAARRQLKGDCKIAFPLFSSLATIGTFSLAMELHPDNQYTGPLNFPAVVTLGERFNLALKVEGGGSTNLSVIPQQCFATPDANMMNPIREDIVVDR